ncbi:MAG: NAD(P)H-quinone oxidoreductase [Actinomycetaceae bacterium]|nr:NAD(P)H-quinone oxidoreductase [Actinomycetaceae bacterium]
MEAIIPTHTLPDLPDASNPVQLSENLTRVTLPTPEPKPDEVRIRIEAFAVNPADVLQSKGLYDPPAGASEILGLECAGIVDAVGTDLPNTYPWIVEGAAVCALVDGGAYADYVCVPATQVLPLPQANENEEYTTAMGLVESAATSWMVLETVGKLHCATATQTVLIHGASGGVGSIAVQLAAAWGHTVYATAGTPQRCRKVEELGAKQCFDYHDDWASQLKDQHPHGADLILDVIGAAGLESNVKALARRGTICIIGMLKGAKGELHIGRLMVKNGTLTTRTLRSQPREKKAEICAALREHVWPLVANGTITPAIGKTLPVSLLVQAHELIAARDNRIFGKITIDTTERR